jgi:signal transduction histidine kinase
VRERTSELIAANERLSAQWERLRKANNFKSEILGKVAHDLKNPLGVILGRAEILGELAGAKKTLADEEVAAQLAHIRRSAENLIGMVDSLLSEAMTDALDIAIRREPVNIPLLVREVADASRMMSDRKEQALAVATPKLLTVSGDHDRLREAIDNLVSNAIKYTPHGGHIHLAVAREGSEAVIRVGDDGPGLSPEDLSRLFGRFQRLSAKPTGGEGSTGLGLSIVKRIVELHGGRITAESGGPGRGTTFTITLPLAQGARAA